jgi:competence protein ComEC
VRHALVVVRRRCVTLDILAPWLPFLADTGDDVNENSIVAMLHYREFRELFMGDAGESSEARLLASGVNLIADALKVGHHGSKYASTPSFINGVDAHAAIISVGRHNTFGHPGPTTLATLERARAAIYRTDRCGAITISAAKPYRQCSTANRLTSYAIRSMIYV